MFPHSLYVFNQENFLRNFDTTRQLVSVKGKDLSKSLIICSITEGGSHWFNVERVEYFKVGTLLHYGVMSNVTVDSSLE